MRFAAVHKLTCYAMVLVTVLPLVLSGDILGAPLTLFAFAVVGSWFLEPGSSGQRATMVWTGATLVATGLLAFDAIARESMVTDIIYFLLVLIVNRLYNRRTSKEYLHVYILSFLLLVISTTVPTGVSFVMLFFVYIVLLVWSLIFHHLRREMEENYLLRHADAKQSERVEVARVLNSRRIVGASFLTGTSIVSLAVFVATIVFFFFFPRVGFGLIGGGAGRQTTMAGFADTVELGQHGTIKDNPEIVMRVQMDVPPTKQIYWRGVAFTIYANGRWMHGSSERTLMRPLPGANSAKRRLAMPRAPHTRAKPAAELLGNAATYEIFLEPLDSRVLFAATKPIAVEVEPRKMGVRMPLLFSNLEQEIRVDSTRHTTVQYRGFSDLEGPDPATLAAAESRVPPMIASRYLVLPRGLPPRIRDLALEITKDAKGAYAQAKAVESYLEQNYEYTLELRHSDGTDPVDEFLFERKAGHCEYFASSMAILLRFAGVPTRVVNGFLGGAWNDIGNFLAVRQGDAHSWIEVYFAGVGWVAFDPTPPLARRPSAGWWTGATTRLRMVMDTMKMAWTRWIIEYDLAKQVVLAKKAAKWLGGKPLPPGVAGAKEAVRRLVIPAAAVILGIFLILMLRHLIRLQRPQKKDGVISARRSKAPVVQLYRKMIAILEKQGFRKDAAQTPKEFAEMTSTHAHPAQTLIERVTRLYYSVRFGGEAAQPNLLDGLDKQLRQLKRMKLEPRAARST